MPEERWQELPDVDLTEDVTQRPSFLGGHWVSNLWRRTIAHLFAEYGGEAKRLQCDANGILQVNSEFTPLTAYETNSGTGSDAYVETDFSETRKTFDLIVSDNKATVKVDVDGTGYGNEFDLPADSSFNFPCQCEKVSIKNETAGSNAVWELIAYS